MNECLRHKVAFIYAKHCQIFRERREPQRDKAVKYLKEAGLHLDHLQ